MNPPTDPDFFGTVILWLQNNPPQLNVQSAVFVTILVGFAIVYFDSLRRKKRFSAHRMFSNSDIAQMKVPELRKLMKKANSLKTLALDAIQSEFGELSVQPEAMKILGLYSRVRRSFPRLGDRDSLDPLETTDGLKRLVSDFAQYATEMLVKIEYQGTREQLVNRINGDFASFQLACSLRLHIPALDSTTGADSLAPGPESVHTRIVADRKVLGERNGRNKALDEAELKNYVVWKESLGEYWLVTPLPSLLEHFKKHGVVYNPEFILNNVKKKDGRPHGAAYLKKIV